MLYRAVHVLIAVLLMAVAAGAATLDDVKARGKLLCGVNPGLQGFAKPNADGRWEGFDADFCRAVAAATFRTVKRGYDPDEVLEELAAENDQLDELGLVLDSDPRRVAQTGKAQVTKDTADAAASGDSNGGKGNDGNAEG